MTTEITRAQPDYNGIAAPTEVDADDVNGNSVANARTMLVLRNSDTGSHDVVFDTPTQVDGFDVAQHTVTIAAGDTLHFAGWPRGAFGSAVTFTADSNLVKVTAYLV